MKKNKTDFNTQCCSSDKKGSALQQIETFFQFNHLAATKERLSSIVSYAVKRNFSINEEPFVIFQFHQSMRSFVSAGYFIMLKERKWTTHTHLEDVSPLVLGLLSEEEYQNPLLVFQKAFREYSIQEFDYFLSGMVYFSMGMYENLPEKNMINPYIHLIKMLDAAYIILERRRKRNTFSESGR